MPKIIEGDLLDQEVDAIVNAWNRNFIPWWLLLPQGVSGAIKRKAGIKPFQELRKAGILNVGDVYVTSAGKLPFKAIIHAASINMIWFATEESIRKSTANALKAAVENSFKSIAFPVLGSGSGSFKQQQALNLMINEIEKFENSSLFEKIIVVKFKNK